MSRKTVPKVIGKWQAELDQKIKDAEGKPYLVHHLINKLKLRERWAQDRDAKYYLAEQAKATGNHWQALQGEADRYKEAIENQNIYHLSRDDVLAVRDLCLKDTGRFDAETMTILARRIANARDIAFADVGQMELSEFVLAASRPVEPTADPPEIGDLRDYVPAAEIRTKHTPDGMVLDHRRLVKFLKDHPDIRWTRPPGKDGKPRENRMVVHLADWHRHRDALVEWDKANKGDAIEAVSEEKIAARTTAVRDGWSPGVSARRRVKAAMRIPGNGGTD